MAELGTLSWALIAAALLVFAFAIRLVFRGARDSEGGGRERLGCGIGVLAFLLWSYAFSLVLDSRLDAVRLGLALLLVLPVVQAVARPRGARIGRAAIALIVAVLLAGPVVGRLWQRLNPSESRSLFLEMQVGVNELRETLARLETHAEGLRDDRADLKLEIAALGHADFDALAQDPAGLARLRELREVDGLLARATEHATEIRARLPELEDELRRLERAVEAEESLGDALGRDDMEALRALLQVESEAPGGTPVEQYAEQQELRGLFDEEF